MYITYNPNPKRKLTDDCVVRAICRVTGKSWYDIYYELCAEGAEVCDYFWKNYVWGRYLTKIGYEPFLLPNTCPDCFTIRDFCELYPNGTFILATGGHVVAVIDGNYYDTSDSGDDVPVYYWKRKEIKHGIH